MVHLTHNPSHPTSQLQSKSNPKHVPRHPTTVPLPPSPPPTETLHLDDHSTKPNQTSINTSSTQSSHQDALLNQSTTNPITTHSNKRLRSDDHQSDSIQVASPPISSPIQSPTHHKSIHSKKRIKLEKTNQSKSNPSSKQEESRSSSSSTTSFRDSPNNPFLVKQGESVRQPGQFHDEKSRKLVYVFRGKRIQYDPAEDLHHTGDSPFKLSKPKLLFPSHEIKPSLSPAITKVQFETHDLFITPQKNKKDKDDVIGLVGLPTPQPTRQKKTSTIDLLNGVGGNGNLVNLNESSSSSSNNNNNNKAKQSLSKGMR